MRIVITGGAGFLGTRLARAILARDSLIDARGVTRPDPRAGAARRGARAGLRRPARADHRRRSRRPRRDRACPHAGHRHGVPSRRRRERPGRGGIRRRHARQSRCHPRAARALPADRRAAEIRVHQFACRVRRAAARSRARRRPADAAGLVRDAEGDRRIPGLRHDAQGLPRWPLAAAADRHRAPGQAEQGRVVVRERHHPRTARRGGCRVSRRHDDEDVGDLAARGDRQPHHRPRSAGGGVRPHALGQRARHLDRRRRHGRGAAARRRRRRRRSRQVAVRSGDRPDRLDLAVELRAEAGERAGDEGGCRFREHRPRVYRRRRTQDDGASTRTRSASRARRRPHAGLTRFSTGSTASNASRNSSGPASFSLLASDRIWRKRRPPDWP